MLLLSLKCIVFDDYRKNIYVLFDFRLREGLKRPLFKGLNRPASEKENMKILENVSLALRNLILQNS